MDRDAGRVQAIVFNKHGVGHMVRVERFPTPGETVSAQEWRFGVDGGKGTNAAVALALNGVRAALVTTVGQDEGGQLGRKWLEDAGVDCSRYRMRRDVQTDVGVVITRADGENVVIGSAVHPCYMDESELVEALDAFPGARCFIAGFEFDQALALVGCRLAKARGMTVMLNPSPLRKALDMRLDFVDYLFVNRIEAEHLAGAGGDPAEVAGMVRRGCGPGCVVMTLGREGCVICDDGGARYCPSYEVACVDSVAAGDAFMAAFAAKILAGRDADEAADWGNRYAAVTVSRPGAILSYPGLEEARAISETLHRRQTIGGT